MSLRPFSTGKLYIMPGIAPGTGAAAATATAITAALTGISGGTYEANRIGDVQDASHDFAFGEHMSYTDAATNRYPVAYGTHEGKATTKYTVRDYNPLLMTRLQNVAADTVSNSGFTTYTFGAGTRPVPCIVVFAMSDQNDNIVQYLVMTNAYSNGLSQNLKLTDFGDVEFSITGVADANTGGNAYLLIEPVGTPV